MYLKKLLSGILILLSVTSAYSFEKVGTTSFQFLKVLTDARSTAMGEAYSAVASHSDAVFWNPAALTRINNLDISVSYMDYFLDVTQTAVSAAYTVPGWGSFGFQLLYVDIGEIDETRVDFLGFRGDTYWPGLTGETYRPYSAVAGLSYARDLTDKFSFGITAKYAYEDPDAAYTNSAGKNEDLSAGTVMFDGGLVYRTGFRSLEVAAAVRHFGPEVKYIEESYPLPQTLNLGMTAFVINSGESLFLQSDKQTLQIAFDLVQPRDYDQQYNLGFEWGYNNMLFLRGGYKINYDEEGLSAGFGINYSDFRLDYSWSDYGEYLDSVQRFSFGVQL